MLEVIERVEVLVLVLRLDGELGAVGIAIGVLRPVGVGSARSLRDEFVSSRR